MKISNKNNSRRKNGQGTTYFDKNKFKYVKQITYEDVDGLKKRKTFYGDSPDECDEKEQIFTKRLEKLRAVPKDKREVTLIDLLTEYNDNRFKSNLIRESTYFRHKKTIETISEETVFANKPLIEVQKYELKNYLGKLPRKSKSMINKIWDQLKLGYDLAVDAEIITNNPLRSKAINKPKSTKPVKDVRAFEPEEQEVLVEILENYSTPENRENYVNQLLIQLYTGMRVGEVNALTESDIDLENNVIHVNKTVSRGVDDAPIVCNTKTSSGIREIPIFDDVRPILEDAIKNKPVTKEGFLFYNTKMNIPFLATNSYAFLKRICEKNGIEYHGQHMLRHTFATNAVNNGVEPQVLKEWMGHSSINITMDTYYNVQKDVMENEIRKMNNN